MTYNEQSDKLAGPIGLLKQYVAPTLVSSCIGTPRGSCLMTFDDRFVTRTGRETAEDSTQVFGGRGITATGMGKFVENVRKSGLITTHRS